MSNRRRPTAPILALLTVGLLAIVVAFVIETAMGSGNGHRYLAVHVVQAAGAVLILVGTILAVRERSRGRLRD
jgi:hypothetical protein